MPQPQFAAASERGGDGQQADQPLDLRSCLLRAGHLHRALRPAPLAVLLEALDHALVPLLAATAAASDELGSVVTGLLGSNGLRLAHIIWHSVTGRGCVKLT